jgi:calcineurin-like phosphoesterase family protein
MFRYKFKKTDSLFVIGCMHLQHTNITRGPSQWSSKERTRDFDTVQDMTQSALSSVQSIPENAHLFILGDMLFGDKSKIYSILDSIPCQNIYYLFGNHCLWMRNHQYDKFKWMGDYLEIFWGHQLVVMCHYPFSVWNESHKGSWMLCSHSHGTFGPSRPDVITGGKVLDCGWDIHKRPIDFHEVEGIMNRKPIFNPDHHDKNTK